MHKVETADEFFGRIRTRTEIKNLLIELPENRLALATREALAGKFDQRKREAQAARRRERIAEQARQEALRVDVADEVRAMLPAPRLGPWRRARTAHARQAARFWDRVAHIDVTAERDGYERFAMKKRLAQAALVMAHFKAAPIDPITWEEYASIATKAPQVIREQARREKERRAIARGKIIAPAGMTLDRAEEIARRALGIADEDNGEE